MIINKENLVGELELMLEGVITNEDIDKMNQYIFEALSDME